MWPIGTGSQNQKCSCMQSDLLGTTHKTKTIHAWNMTCWKRLTKPQNCSCMQCESWPTRNDSQYQNCSCLQCDLLETAHKTKTAMWHGDNYPQNKSIHAFNVAWRQVMRKLKSKLFTQANWLSTHTCQTTQFTSIKYSFFIIVGGCGQTGKWKQENIIFMRFGCCFKPSTKDWKTVKRAADECHHQIHTGWLSAIGWEISLEVRFEVVHAYLARHCFFLPLPHVPIGIQNAAGTSEKTKDTACIREIQVHKLWTKVYSQQGLTAMSTSTDLVVFLEAVDSQQLSMAQSRLPT